MLSTVMTIPVSRTSRLPIEEICSQGGSVDAQRWIDKELVEAKRNHVQHRCHQDHIHGLNHRHTQRNGIGYARLSSESCATLRCPSR